jgi:hypothetical protein
MSPAGGEEDKTDYFEDKADYSGGGPVEVRKISEKV